MSTHQIRPLAYSMAALLMTACSGASAPTEDPSSTAAAPTSSHASSAVASSAATSPPTTTTSDLGTRFPNTVTGAEGFARQYLAVLNGAYAAGDIGTLGQYSTPECSRCDGWLNYFGEMQANHQHAVGTFIVVRDIMTVLPGPDKATAVAQITVPEARIVDQSGRTVRVRKAEGNLTATFFLRFDTQWRVVGSRVE